MELTRILQEKKAEIPFGDETLTVVYRPGALTPEMLIAMEKAENSGDTEAQMLFVTRLLVETIVSWDLTDGGEPYPLTVDALMKLPLAFLTKVSNALVEEESPKEMKSAT